MSKSKPTTPDAFQTIDPTALATVAGGAGSSSSGDEQVMAALTGIMDSLSAIAKRPSGPDMSTMMMFMMALNSGGGSQPCAAPCAAQPVAWNWENGVMTPKY